MVAASNNCFNVHFRSTNPIKTHFYRFDRRVKSNSCSKCKDKQLMICDFLFSPAFWNVVASSLATVISISVCNKASSGFWVVISILRWERLLCFITVSDLAAWSRSLLCPIWHNFLMMPHITACKIGWSTIVSLSSTVDGRANVMLVSFLDSSLSSHLRIAWVVCWTEVLWTVFSSSCLATALVFF